MRAGAKGKGRKLRVSSVPAPAAVVIKFELSARLGGGTMETSSMRAFCQGGISKGRLFGLAKKSNTRSTGYGSHCSVWNEKRMGIRQFYFDLPISKRCGKASVQRRLAAWVERKLN